jgi:uncharacterized protein with HEPN domain
VRDERVYLHRDAIEDIVAYCGNDHPAFLGERMRQDATFRKMEVIGQAAKNLSEQTKSREPEIPWKQFAGMRDKVSYDYFGVNLEIVWGMVQKEPHKLRQAIAALFWRNRDRENWLQAKRGTREQIGSAH